MHLTSKPALYKKETLDHPLLH